MTKKNHGSDTGLLDEPETTFAQNSQIEVATQMTMPKFETITFFNLKDPNQELKFFYHSATHPLRHYTLEHGKEYTLCYEIIDHLEGSIEGNPNSCQEPIYDNENTPNGKMSKAIITSYKSKYQCKRARNRR
jgi:hypothetical protein